MDIHIHIDRVIVHDHDAAVLDAIQQLKETIMPALDELKAQLTAADEQTNQIATTLAGTSATISEIATDIDRLLELLANGTPGSTEVAEATAQAAALTARLSTTAQQLTETATTLQGVAAKS